MNIAKKLTALVVSCAMVAYAEGNTFTRIRYNGGSVPSKVSPHEWSNRLTVTPEVIVLELKDKQRLEIPSKSVTSLSYGQEAHRRVGTMIALAVLVAPVALFGLFHKTRLHFIGIQYTTPDHKSGGVLLQGDKGNYRGILVALQGVSGAPVSVSEKEREYIPVGLTTNVTKMPDEKEGAAPSNPVPPSAAKAVTGAPLSNADITKLKDAGVADQLIIEKIGSSPANYKLDTDDIVELKKAGLSDGVIGAMLVASKRQSAASQVPPVPPPNR